MTKGRPIDVIAIPHGEWAKSICETCPNVQWLNVDKGVTAVCANGKCNIFKSIMRRRKGQ